LVADILTFSIPQGNPEPRVNHAETV
jgi:hypothetical protein